MLDKYDTVTNEITVANAELASLRRAVAEVRGRCIMITIILDWQHWIWLRIDNCDSDGTGLERGAMIGFALRTSIYLGDGLSLKHNWVGFVAVYHVYY